jgi:SOS response regulatory protein OraA/RecX
MTAYERALALIAKRDRTEYQIRLLLDKDGYASDETDDALSRLRDSGYVNDAAYAERYLESLIDKGRGRRRIEDAMIRHGLSDALISDTLRAHFPHETETEYAMETARAVVAALPEDADPKFRARKIAAKLLVKGYSYDIIEEAVDRLATPDEEM